MSNNKRKLTILLSFILSILMISTTLFGSSIDANAASVSGQAIVSEAMNYLGKPYAWGASGPNSFDCSGLTSYVYKKVANINIGRDTYTQINSGREVSQNELQPGDLVFPSDHHVGIYIGDGKIIHAPQTGDVVKISSIWSFWRARRIIDINLAQSDSRSENPLFSIIFNPSFYSAQYTDLKNAFGNDSEKLRNHFLSVGIKEGRMASEVFDVSYYLKNNVDLVNAFGENNYEAAYKHFLDIGYKESRNLSPVFDMGYYIKNNPDVAKNFGNDYGGIMFHFLTAGMREGRKTSKNFNIDIYKVNYEELRNAFGNDNQAYFDHYLRCGKNEGCIADRIIQSSSLANLVFNAEFYANKYTDLKNAFGYDEVKLFNHFLTAGIREGRVASEVFDVSYYLKKNMDLVNAFGENNYEAAYKHFLDIGYKESRNLSPVFNMGYYIKNNPDVARNFGNDYGGIMFHFLTAGMREGRQASENFNVTVYKNGYEDLRNAFGNDNQAYFDHYLRCGKDEGRIAK